MHLLGISSSFELDYSNSELLNTVVCNYSNSELLNTVVCNYSNSELLNTVVCKLFEFV